MQQLIWQTKTTHQIKMKSSSVNCGEIKLNQLVILLLLCLLETIQCHSIADAGTETTQDVHTTEWKQPSNSLKVLLAQQRKSAQLELPPVGDSNAANTQTSTTSRPAAVIGSANSHQRAGATSTTTSPRQRWIDNILINVEVMNMSNERRRQQIAAWESGVRHASSEQEAQDESPITVTAFDEPASFQVPTDSGEDLLESEPETSTAAASERPPAIAHTLVEEQQRKLIESNNVSAVVLEASLSASPPEVDNGARIVTMASKQVLSCEEAYTQCALREVCAPTLKLYNDECQDLLSNRTGECSARCVRAMIALRSSEAGEDLANCDCQANEFCELSKQRSQLCQAQVERALEPTSVVSCSVASSICMANQLCSTALGYYYRRCQSLFSQRHCSDRCNNSLTILHKQPQAMKLINCQCDGSEEFPCVKYKTYTEQLCLNKQSAPPANESTPNPADRQQLLPASLDNETTGASHLEALLAGQHDPQAAASNEDDKLNLTNDPSDLPPTLVQPAGGRVADDDDDDFAPPAPTSDGATDPANANNYFFNGIQQPATIEDNWIPLLTGRYFTNLHHQQQGRQQQQKVKQQQQQQQQQQRKSNSRRAQKNAKQKVRSNETNRKRHAPRPYMFALTSAATQASHSLILVASSCLTLAVALLAFP